MEKQEMTPTEAFRHFDEHWYGIVANRRKVSRSDQKKLSFARNNLDVPGRRPSGEWIKSMLNKYAVDADGAPLYEFREVVIYRGK
jgi:hypothetical protein